MASPYLDAATDPRASNGSNVFDTLSNGLAGLSSARLNNAMFKADLGLRQQQLQQQDSQFGQQMDVQNRQLDQQGSQFDRGLKLDERRFESQDKAQSERLLMEKLITDNRLANDSLARGIQSDEHKVALQQARNTENAYIQQRVDEVAKEFTKKNINLATPEGRQQAMADPTATGMIKDIFLDSFDSIAMRAGGVNARAKVVERTDENGDPVAYIGFVDGEGNTQLIEDNGEPRVFDMRKAFDMFASRAGATDIEFAQNLRGGNAPTLGEQVLSQGQKTAPEQQSTVSRLMGLLGGGNDQPAVNPAAQEAPRVPNPGAASPEVMRDAARLAYANDANQLAQIDRIGQSATKNDARSVTPEQFDQTDFDAAADFINSKKPEGSSSFTRGGFFDDDYEVFAGANDDDLQGVQQRIVSYTQPIMSNTRKMRPLLRALTNRNTLSDNDIRKLMSQPDLRRQIQEILVDSQRTTTRGRRLTNDLHTDEAIPEPTQKDMVEIAKKLRQRSEG